MRLYDIKKGSKIYEECSDGSEYFVFDHLDGMYSYCKTEKGATVHLAGGASLIPYKDGYKIGKELDE
jgi:hypothetical protein